MSFKWKKPYCLFHNPWWSDPARIDSDKDIKVTRKDFFLNEKIIGIPACFFLYLLSGD